MSDQEETIQGTKVVFGKQLELLAWLNEVLNSHDNSLDVLYELDAKRMGLYSPSLDEIFLLESEVKLNERETHH